MRNLELVFKKKKRDFYDKLHFHQKKKKVQRLITVVILDSH